MASADIATCEIVIVVSGESIISRSRERRKKSRPQRVTRAGNDRRLNPDLNRLRSEAEPERAPCLFLPPFFLCPFFNPSPCPRPSSRAELRGSCPFSLLSRSRFLRSREAPKPVRLYDREGEGEGQGAYPRASSSNFPASEIGFRSRPSSRREDPRMREISGSVTNRFKSSPALQARRARGTRGRAFGLRNYVNSREFLIKLPHARPRKQRANILYRSASPSPWTARIWTKRGCDAN